MVQNNTVLSGKVPKWGQYPVGVFPGCNTNTLRMAYPFLPGIGTREGNVEGLPGGLERNQGAKDDSTSGELWWMPYLLSEQGPPYIPQFIEFGWTKSCTA